MFLWVQCFLQLIGSDHCSITSHNEQGSAPQLLFSLFSINLHRQWKSSGASPAASPKSSCLFPAEGLIIMAFHCLPVPAIISWFLAKQWFTQHIKVSFHFCFQFPTFWCFPAISLPEDILPFFFPYNLLLHSIYHHLSTPPLPFMLLEQSFAGEFRGRRSLHLILLCSWRFFTFIMEF